MSLSAFCLILMPHKICAIVVSLYSAVESKDWRETDLLTTVTISCLKQDSSV